MAECSKLAAPLFGSVLPCGGRSPRLSCLLLRAVARFQPTKVGGRIVSKTGRVATPTAEKPPRDTTSSQPKARRSQPGKTGAAAADRPASEVAKITRPQPSRAAPVLATVVKVLSVEPGIYALHIFAADAKSREISGVTVPITHLGSPPRIGSAIEIVASFPQRGPWFGPEGGTAVINSAAAGQVLVTTYGEPGESVASPDIDLRRLDRPETVAPAPSGSIRPAAGAGAIREVPTEILLHIERAGDRLFPGRGWVGALGRKLRIEGFNIRPLEGLLPGDVEFKAFEPNGQETPWVSAGTLCGTRGRGLPLTGFAVRLAPHLRDRFEAVYEGSFFTAGIVGPNRDGEPCRSAVANDPLEAVNIRLIERTASRGAQKPSGA